MHACMSTKENEEIEITLNPIKKIVIFECTKFPNNEFFNRIELLATSGQPIVLNWSEGIVFLFSHYQPESDLIIEQALKGISYWGGVMFSSMPKYEPMKRFGAREVPIIDQTLIPYFKRVALWIKKNYYQ